MPDPENSVFYDAYVSGDRSLRMRESSLIEGIGRPRVELSFLPEVIDGMLKVPDVASVGAIRYLERVLGRRCGGSTGTNFIGALHLARQMHSAGESGSIVTILCDSGDRYGHSYFNDDWVARHGLEVGPATDAIARSAEHGQELPWPLRGAGQSGLSA